MTNQSMIETPQDLFISHAGADKEQYVLPLTEALTREHITFWLDSIEIGWGDSIALRLNEGLRESRFVLLCLSSHFIERPWPEAELNAVLSIQNESGRKRVLPLVLDSKERVLAQYPLLAGISYREFNVSPDSLASELAQVVRNPGASSDAINVIIESAHTGKLSNLLVSPRVSIRWLSEKAQAGLGLNELADTGGFHAFRIKWVLVDVKARDAWIGLPRSEQRQLRAVIAASDGPRFSYLERDRLNDLGVYDGVVFHLFPVEDEEYYEDFGGDDEEEE